MKKINIEKYKDIKQEPHSPRCEYQEQLEDISKWLGLDIKRTARLIKGWKNPNLIRDRKKYCEQNGKNPKALFQYLCKTKWAVDN